MDLLSLAISLALKMDSQNQFTGNYDLNISPTFGVEAPVGNFGAAAMALPGVVLHDPRYSDIHNDPHLMREELDHGRQQRALGPAFWGAYAATAGRPFEPYDALGYRLGVPANEAGLAGRDTGFDQERMWLPPEELEEQFPIFRISRQDDTTRLQFMPGYPGATFRVGE